MEYDMTIVIDTYFGSAHCSPRECQRMATDALLRVYIDDFLFHLRYCTHDDTSSHGSTRLGDAHPF